MADGFELKTARKYTNKAGEEKTAWTTVGTLYANEPGNKVAYKIYLEVLPFTTGKDGRVEMVAFPPRDEALTQRSGHTAPGRPPPEEDPFGWPATVQS